MDDNGQMRERGKQGWFAVLLREHPALLVSIVYVAASTIGMVYSWQFLGHFGINVFNYALIGDFLLASLKEPFTWVLVLLALLLMAFDNALSRRAQRKGTRRWLRWYGSDVYRSLNYLVAIFIILVFLYVYADSRAEEMRAGEGDIVDVVLADGSAPKTALLLGTTGQFLFLYDVESRRVDIHPHENVQSISFTGPTAE